MAHIFKRGNIWWVSFVRSGKTVRKSLETKNKKFAKKMLTDIEYKILQEKLPFPLANKTTLDDLAKLIVSDYKNAGKDLNSLNYRVDKLLSFFGKNTSANAITSDSINQFITQMQQNGLANATINRYLSTLLRMFNLGKDSKPRLVYSDPPKITKFRETNVRKGFTKIDKFLTLRAAIAPYLKTFITVAYEYGCRRGELRKLRWGHVDLSARQLNISADISKTKKARQLPLTDELLEMLTTMRKEQEAKGKITPTSHLFLNKAGTGPITDFRRDWNEACRSIGLGYGYAISKQYREKWQEKLSPGPILHDFRRSAARNLMQSGASRKVAKLLLGQVTDEMFDRYHIVDTSDLERTMKRQQEFKKEEMKKNEKKKE